ncbi:pyruvate dehydrogenase E1 component [Pseudomonas citronellolis]|uniref:alpha-ketoglutarate dehydrogenase n=1 Tax=Pseudomonas citronellolis TaxID=53408 RepID=UPI0020A1528A|nr:alpha-ketoglutarate dehydrogenase [Pseudomonas citronellolis]MCP1646220.1 pyruvate dehydrogenase E1 component [Pseudomonas citronellolis]MCP1667627.1 pyruvate dehydrogenase E1 component [Pseudomonas citronellolis]MCP1700847.1 pyruvate dehydrogenase E1 component [Pseudomonas citronellolis]MCP1705215.1 pyruvate dehydrogenase E1 component [Pseudomonas citronellolis]MCP1800888.1 pyruvate dehydrogenase E1 component [Pseudomonas citronellolis]
MTARITESSRERAEQDSDRQETHEWLDALEAVARSAGGERVDFLLQRLAEHASHLGVRPSAHPYSLYQNSIPLEQQPAFPGDLAMEERITSIIRWNALAMVARANKAYGELGGHIASYASAAEIFEVGFNHFFRADSAAGKGDLVYFQPHSAPGVYARAFLEGRLGEEQLQRYRQEVDGGGLCSYPHPWLMPDFWQFPTGSMGIGPISAIYQARFLRYLEHRGIADTAQRHVWGVFGDGEMDEPESLAALSLAAREKLDNLTFVINCNLQRLDGPVRGNGQIIQELEALFSGAGWNVIKVIWGSDWDALFARDRNHVLLRRFAHTVDGQYQTLGANDGNYNRAHFFDLDPELQALVSHMSPEEIDGLRRGGHDFRKLHAAFAAAKAHDGRPTVILAKTKKGFGMGQAGESRNTSHQQKKLDIDALKAFRDRFALPLDDAALEEMRFYKPAEDSAELRYLRERRETLGGYLPRRVGQAEPLALPALESYAQFALQPDERESSTTTAVVRLFSNLLKDKQLGPRIVPIVADEARTFGMANLFRQIGIYSPAGQLYEPEDAGAMLYYKEARDGQLLEEGITEAGAISSWVAAATSYSVNGVAMLPFYIYYSMFGFQRIGDLIWAAADQRARGFLIGATAGRTTLAGEGLQHQDGTSQLIASTVPNCRAYDPAFASEAAVIIDHGGRRMLQEQHDEFYYLTVTNENYVQAPLEPAQHADVIKGMRLFGTRGEGKPAVRLLGSGAILREVIGAAELLAEEWGVASEIWSVTSFSELAREAREVEREQLFGDDSEARSHLQTCLPGDVPVVAASDYVRGYAQLIAPYLQAPYTALGTDGFGRSDTRPALRRFFELDRQHIALAALAGIDRDKHAQARARYAIDGAAGAPWNR